MVDHVDRDEPIKELQPDMSVEWNGSVAHVFDLEAMFSGERTILYDRADFQGPVSRVTIISAEKEEGREAKLAAQIEFEPYEPVQRGFLDIGRRDDVDPLRKFLGYTGSLLDGPFVESDFGPTRFTTGDKLEDNGLAITKTVFGTVFKVVAGDGNNLLVWVDQEKRRIIVTNSRQLTGENLGRSLAVSVKPPAEGTLDHSAIAEGFLKTVMRTVDYSVGLTEAEMYHSPRHYRLNRTYQIGKEPQAAPSRTPSIETTRNVGTAATHQSMQSEEASDPTPRTLQSEQPPTQAAQEPAEQQPEERPQGRRLPENLYRQGLPEIKKPEGLTLDDIGGLADIKRGLKDVAVSFQHADIMEKWGAERPQGILLYGPPGTGKTMLARALAAEIDADMMMVQSDDIYGMWMGESEKRIKDIFKAARKHEGRLILFFDELDAIIGISTGPSEGGASTRNSVAGVFKQELNTLAEENPNVLVIGTTNFLEQIDPSLIRSGRFDVRLRVPMPDQEAREQIFQSIMRKRMAKTGSTMFGAGIDVAALAELADGLSGADINAMLRKLILDKAMAEARSGISAEVSVTHDEIVQALAEFRTNLHQQD